MYSPLLKQHFESPNNQGLLEQPDGVGESRYLPCGDRLVVHVQLDQGLIKAARFQGKACGPVTAVASLASSKILGLSPQQARQLSPTQLDQELGGLPPSKRHALWMFLEALTQALDQATSAPERTS